jgi:hypothetical protein
MNRIKHVVYTATVALGLALAPAAMAAGHAGGGFGGGFGGHFGGFSGHSGGFGDHVGSFGGEHASGVEPSLGAHSFDGGNLVAGRGFAGRGHELANGFAGGRHDLGDGLTLDGRNIGGGHLMYGRVPRFGRGGVFLGYYYPTPKSATSIPATTTRQSGATVWSPSARTRAASGAPTRLLIIDVPTPNT